MKSTIATTLIFSFLSTSYAQDGTTAFTLVTASSNPALHLQPVDASDFQWWVGKSTASYCPDQVQPNCPAGTITSVAGGNVTLSMNVEVPGGQQVYVNPAGQIKYTQAHSASMDPNSTVTGWDYHPSVTRGFGLLSWATEFGHGFIACPATDGTAGAYTIQTITGDALPAQCEQVDLLVPEETDTGSTGVDGVTAWQYT